MRIKNIIVVLTIICCTTAVSKANIFTYEPGTTLDWGVVSPGASLTVQTFKVICGPDNSPVDLTWSTKPENLIASGIAQGTTSSVTFLISGNALSGVSGVQTQTIKIIYRPYFWIDGSWVLTSSDWLELTTLYIKYTVNATAPSIPQNLTASEIERNSLKLSWTASTDDQGVKGYYVWMNNSNIWANGVTTTSVNITQRTPNTEYTFNVSAFDALYTSDLSNTLHVITSPLVLTLSSDISSSNVTYDAIAFNQVTLSPGFTFTAKNNTYRFSAKINTGPQQWTTTRSAIIAPKNNNNEINITNKQLESTNLGLAVSLFPNPTADKLYINGLSNANIQVFDLSGRQVLHFTNVNGNIDVSVLNSGTYIIKLNDEKNNSIQKFIKL